MPYSNPLNSAKPRNLPIGSISGLAFLLKQIGYTLLISSSILNPTKCAKTTAYWDPHSGYEFGCTTKQEVKDSISSSMSNSLIIDIYLFTS